MRLCSYIITNDKGLAPNPFWGYCTLAVCTLNHMGIRAENGDWLMGTTTTYRGNKLIFAMQVSEVLLFNLYYNDIRFEKKKPVMDGTWRQRCGDNMYYQGENGEWKQHRSIYHLDKSTMEKDLKHPFVFIAEHFYYFGENAVEIPLEYKDLIWRRQGCKCKHATENVEGFLNWLQTNFSPGIHGKPYDIDEAGCNDC